MKKLIYIVAGARPNFMKIAPIIRVLKTADTPFYFRLIHTGQHYDHEMSDVFFEELGIPRPDYNLDCGGGSHAEQTARIMLAFERVCQTGPHPDCVLVVGDVNSTLACSIVAKKLHIPVAHVEAGLRSRDKNMPEEINRLVTDSISDWFFCTEPAGVDNLLREGHSAAAIFHVGHVMVDNLLYQKRQLEHRDRGDFATTAIKLRLGRFGVVTLHRPSNVDDEEVLAGIIGALNRISAELPLVFPIHPRTFERLNVLNVRPSERITLLGPQSYMEFLNLWKDATLVLTDSGGLQEETTALGVPCLTLRQNTERPITVEEGSNVLVGTDPAIIVESALSILRGEHSRGQRPALWDGQSANRIVEQLAFSLG